MVLQKLIRPLCQKVKLIAIQCVNDVTSHDALFMTFPSGTQTCYNELFISLKGQYDFEVDEAPDYIYNSQIGDIYYST